MTNLTSVRPVICLVIKIFPSRESSKDKFTHVMDNSEMLREFNRLFADLIEECDKNGQCLDHHGYQDIHNHLLSDLNGVLDDGHIPSGHQVDDVLEEMRVKYYQKLKMD